GPGLSLSSQRNFSNSFIVDGLSANDDAAGVSGIPYGVDAIEEFQVVTSGGQAELGRALGGYVNIVTRSGGNDTHGDVYGYFRDRRLNAANPLTDSTLPMNQKEFGGSLGGPIARNRAFYFSNFEERRLLQSGVTTIPSDVAAAIDARLAAVGFPGAPLVTGVYPNPVTTSTLLAKVDDSIGGGDQASARFSLYTASSDNSRGAGGIAAPSASA